MGNKIKEAFGSITAGPEWKDAAYAGIAARAKREQRRRGRYVRGISLAAASVLVLLFVVSVTLYNTETAYISLDVNPSISLSVNRYGKVIKANAYNAEGGAVVDSVDARNKDYTEAVRLMINSPRMQPYLAGTSTVWVAVQAADSARVREVESSVQGIVQEALVRHHSGAHVEVACVDEQTRQMAETSGVSAAKYTAILELQQYDAGVSVEEYRHHSMHDITTEIATHHGGGGHGGASGGDAQAGGGTDAQPGAQYGQDGTQAGQDGAQAGHGGGQASVQPEHGGGQTGHGGGHGGHNGGH